jgi:hypothetical protein
MIAPRFPPLKIPITCAATIPRPHGPNTIKNNLAQPPAADIWRAAPKFYPPLDVAADRRYRIPNPSDFQRPIDEAEIYYLVTRGQAVGIFIDW